MTSVYRAQRLQFRKMASLAEEIIEIYPDKFNCYRKFDRHYDISEAHQTLRSLCIFDEEFQFNELVT